MQPSLEPATRTERPWRIDVGCFVKQERNESVNVLGELIKIDVVQLLPGSDTEP